MSTTVAENTKRNVAKKRYTGNGITDWMKTHTAPVSKKTQPFKSKYFLGAFTNFHIPSGITSIEKN